MATPAQLTPSGIPARVLVRLAGPLPAAVTLAGATGFAALLAVHLSGGGTFDVPWAPSLGLRLTLTLDGLGALFALLSTGIGTLVAAYSAGYLPRHLDHQDRSRVESPAFYGLLALFMVAMVGVATAQDLVLLFLFYDLTAVCSYFLIGFDRHEDLSRVGALTTLVVTGGAALLLIAAALVLEARTGTFSLPGAVARADADTATLTGVLIAVAALAKSAQVPLQFWLPRAMSAPTPVSAYLHSAALVAVGVLVLARVLPLLDRGGVLWILVVAGTLSILVGGTLALGTDHLKQILAYSTIAQYGFVCLLLGLGTKAGAVAAMFWVLAHGLAKSALFLAAGAVTEATGGAARLRDLGGLARRLPVLAAAAGAAAASLGALPLTAGFFRDELLHKAAKEEGALVAVALACATGLTLAYTARFWAGIFAGRERTEAHRPPAVMVAPVVALAAAGVVLGVWAAPFESLAGLAAGAALATPVEASVAYHPDLRAENLLALLTFAVGGVLWAARDPVAKAARAASDLGRVAGPERAFGGSLVRLHVLSTLAYRLERRELRGRIATILAPAGALVAAALVARADVDAFRAGTIVLDDLPLVVTAAVAALAALAATAPRRHLMLILAVSSAGLSLTAAYAAFGAPDVALVAGTVELLLALLFVLVFRSIPRDVLRHAIERNVRPGRTVRDAVVGVVAGGVAFVVSWAALSSPTDRPRAADALLDRTERAHAKDTVTAILADFRGLDTLVEITVVGVAALGVVTYLRRAS